MPSGYRPDRETDFAGFPSTTPIVIDNGASTFRIGWAGEAEPRVAFRNIVQRPRHRSSGETVTVVGDTDPALMKYFDCTRSAIRSPFDDDVVYQFEYMEYILDFGFDRLGATSEVGHPILMTECECNPSFSRARMSELLFETYGVPSIAFGIDDVFSYKYNQKLGNCGEDGLAISCEHGTCHVVPFLKGEPVLGACCRTNVGGFHITDFLRQLLSLKYPYHSASITWEKAEELKKEHCYVALDYMSELQIFKLKEKKKQILLKTTTEGRMRAKQRRAEEEALREKQEEERLHWDMDPTFVNKAEAVQQTPEPPKVWTLTAEDYRISIGIERFRCPEILFQPGMIGIDQAGIDEMVSISLRRLMEDEAVKERLCQSILVTGGCSLIPGMIPRLESGIRQFRPYLSPLKLVRAADPLIDAWRGAAAFAASSKFGRHTFSLADYREHGENLFHRYNIVYSL
uniref:Actin-related protein 5 n=1 Tax=Oryza rufipogon TaxID=4529 RepID=A0A0E0MR89_ORYRU